MVCLDTSVIVALMRGNQDALGRLGRKAEEGARVSTTMMNLCELYAGVFASKDPARDLDRVEGLISRLELLDLTRDATSKYGEVSNHPDLRRKPMGDFDLIIACIALSYGEPLATRNPKHFSSVPGLTLESW